MKSNETLRGSERGPAEDVLDTPLDTIAAPLMHMSPNSYVAVQIVTPLAPVRLAGDTVNFRPSG